MNNSYITIIKEKRTVLSRKRVPLNQNECTADFRIGVPFEQNLQLISTHLLSLAEDFCDRYIFLYDGRIVEQGTKAEILQKQQMNKGTSLEQIYMSLIGEGEHYAGVQKTVMCE